MAEIPERISVNTRYLAVWHQTTGVVTERYRILFQYAAVVLALLGIGMNGRALEAKLLALALVAGVRVWRVRQSTKAQRRVQRGPDITASS